MTKVKRSRAVQGKTTAEFKSPEGLIEALKSRNPDVLKNSNYYHWITLKQAHPFSAALVSFRNQITVAYGERPGIRDTRIVLVTSWLEKSPGANELFDIWDTGSNFTSLVLISLAHTISLISGTPAGSVHGPTILRTLLDSTHARRLNAHLASGQTDVVLAALKVLGAAALIDQRLTFDAVSWTAKVRSVVYLSIRTALVTLILALLPLTLPIELFTALFKGIAQDEGVVVKLVLETCWEKVWGDVKVPKSLKVKVFGGVVIYLQPLYDRMDPDITDPLAPADVVHHFLLALCTKPGTGICFKSRGWHPRPSENPFEDLRPAGKDEEVKRKLLRTLRPAVDARQHELAVRILNACPDLVGAYFAKGAAQLGLGLEPRLSTRWITSVGFIAAVVKADLPTDSFYVDAPTHTLATSSTSSRAYRADPPPLSAIVESVIPNLLTRACTGTLVQHTTIRLITQCLLKLSNVLEAFPPGWSERAAEVVDAVRKRVPELGVVVGITQEASKALQKNEDTTTIMKWKLGAFACRGFFETDVALCTSFPGTMAETRFDVGKLLQETEIHMLRLLGENDQFVWSAKPSGSQHTHMYRLLSLHLRTPYPQLRAASASLVVRLLGSGVLFEHDPKEILAWIESLPRTKYTNSAGTEDDITIFLGFFDDVLSRCVKTPYKYLEQGRQLYSSSGDVSRMPSPLFMALLEQLRHKPMESTSRRLIASFVARLVKLLVGKMELKDAKAIAGYMRDIFVKESGENFGLKVVSRLETFLDDLAPAEPRMDMDTSVTSTPAAVLFVQEIESVDTADNKTVKAQVSAKIVGWVRSSGEELGALDLIKLLKFLVGRSVDEVALRDFLEEVEFRTLSPLYQLWWGTKKRWKTCLMPLRIMFQQDVNLDIFHTAFLNSLSRFPVELLTWACGLMAHQLGAAIATARQSTTRACLSILTSLCQYAGTTSEKDNVKHILFTNLPIVKSLLMEHTWVDECKGIVSALLNRDNDNDLALASPYSQYWSGSLLEASSTTEIEANAPGFSVWIPFTPASTCIRVLKLTLSRIQDWETISPTLKLLLEFRQLASALPQLIKLPKLTDFPGLLKLSSTIVQQELPLCLDLSSVEADRGLSDIVKQATGQWSSRTGVIDSVSWRNFLGWTETEELAKMSTALIYLSKNARDSFVTWMEEQDTIGTHSIGPCFAVVDCYTAIAQAGGSNLPLERTSVNKILDCAARTLFKRGESEERQRWAMHILFTITQKFPRDIDATVQAVTKRFPSNHKDVFHRYALSFVATWRLNLIGRIC
ncbi:Ribosome 60S biogenesis N-terminal [Rhizoctonia solani]|uniref:Ribosome 60S biogenesis N-terminal n=1 Tax=Rhizoctonia solani TaxID=456999 RepID=A0A8H7IHB2_9AGAM|nr:Ribosome 60S biogenesis N-terminal [Rhizoctonia solani]